MDICGEAVFITFISVLQQGKKVNKIEYEELYIVHSK